MLITKYEQKLPSIKANWTHKKIIIALFWMMFLRQRSFSEWRASVSVFDFMGVR
jgi:hypothetical protein